MKLYVVVEGGYGGKLIHYVTKEKAVARSIIRHYRKLVKRDEYFTMLGSFGYEVHNLV